MNLESGMARTVGEEFYKAHENTRERSGPEVGPEKSNTGCFWGWEEKEVGRTEGSGRQVLRAPHRETTFMVGEQGWAGLRRSHGEDPTRVQQNVQTSTKWAPIHNLQLFFEFHLQYNSNLV